MVIDAVMMHKCLNGLSPNYLSYYPQQADKIIIVTASIFHLVQSLLAIGQCAFYYCGMKIWNNLRKDLRETTILRLLRDA